MQIREDIEEILVRNNANIAYYFDAFQYISSFVTFLWLVVIVFKMKMRIRRGQICLFWKWVLLIKLSYLQRNVIKRKVFFWTKAIKLLYNTWYEVKPRWHRFIKCIIIFRSLCLVSMISVETNVVISVVSIDHDNACKHTCPRSDKKSINYASPRARTKSRRNARTRIHLHIRVYCLIYWAQIAPPPPTECPQSTQLSRNGTTRHAHEFALSPPWRCLFACTPIWVRVSSHWPIRRQECANGPAPLEPIKPSEKCQIELSFDLAGWVSTCEGCLWECGGPFYDCWECPFNVMELLSIFPQG